jgi:heavy metal translocating P-type ATPase
MIDVVVAGPVDVAPGAALLSLSERRSLSIQLTLSMIAGGLLILSAILRFGIPHAQAVADLVAGAAAALVAIPVLSAAWHSLRRPSLHGVTDQLIALALVAAWASGDLTTAALLPLAMIIGHVLEERSLLGSQEAIRALGRLTQGIARRVLPHGEIEVVPTEALRPADVVELRAGDRVPADGIVRSGSSNLDTAPITGESVPVEATLGAPVFAGSIALDGRLEIEITRVGKETALGRVVSLLQSAELAKPPITRLLERYAGQYIVLVLLIACVLWLVTSSTAVMLTVLVAACPCALVLAAPATAIAAIAVAGRHGILIKGTAFLEELATVDSVIFDKTGTVTLGELRLAALEPEPGVGAGALLQLASSIGAVSNHPVSRALAGAIRPEERTVLTDVRETHGLGVVAHDGEARVALGRPELFAQLRVAAGAPPRHDGPIAGVARDSAFLGWVLLADEPRAEARQAIADLKSLGLRRQLLLTGDRSEVARRIGAMLDVPEVCAEALPEQKMQRVIDEIAAGHRPLVVGDGINDSLALKAGAVGIAMGAQGSDVALASSDLVLMTNDLRRLGTCIRLSRRCRRTIHANVAIGLGWTVVIVGLAATGVLGAGGPLIAAVLHNVSTLVVMGNAGSLLKFDESRFPAVANVTAHGTGIPPARIGENPPVVASDDGAAEIGAR